ncbi:hypothetical protein BV502_03910 [Leucobacter sp. OAMLP11]|uniref:endonuclease domain-containing protein n=1 Tax=unclassified Leucobacter TaxID=2621730 RepID=UPI000C17427E|nr:MULTISPECIES: DUF559 domain-containing protein [unclassified Leucobacter]PIO51686.1 hypothetical protein BV502_03910 [Leucobacter sp. OAMLP11]
MTRRQTALPGHLARGPFSRAEARVSGVSDRVLWHRRFAPTPHGAHWLSADAKASLELQTREDRWIMQVLSFVPVLRHGEAFSHSTALRLFECPIRANADQPVHLTIPSPAHARRAAGTIGHISADGFEAVWIESTEIRPWIMPESGLPPIPVVPIERALRQSAAELPLIELVVAVDHAIRERRTGGLVWALADLDALRAGAATFTGRGARRLRRALGLARVGAESRMETLLRLLLEAYGLAGYFEFQVEVSDGAGVIGRFDLVCVERRVILEYDGEQHRTSRAQYLRDNRRLDRARDAGWTVIRAHSIDLFEPGARGRLIVRLAQKLGRVQAPALVEVALLPN